MTVNIPIRTTYNGSGFESLRRDTQRAEREAIQATQRQIAEHKRVLALTKKLDKDLAGPKASFKDQMAGAFGTALISTDILQGILAWEKDFIVQSLQAAAAAERFGKATDALGARFGTTSTEIVRAIQEASQYTINQMNAMQSANQAMLLGVAKSPAEFERLTKIAVTLGRAMGQDATKSISDLTIGIGRQSRLILDNLGILVDTQGAYEKYAASIGKSAGELTEAEQKQAFLNEVLDQGEKKIAGMGDQTLDAAAKVERMNARWSDFQIEFGKAMLAVSDGSGAMDAMDGFLVRLTDGAKAWQGAIDNMKLLAEAQRRLAKESDDAGVATEALGWAMDRTASNEAVFQQQLQSLIGWFYDAGEAQDELATKVQEVAAEQAAAAEQAKANAQASEEEAAAMEDAARAAQELAERLERVNEVRRDAVAGMLEIEATAAEESSQAWQDYYDGVEQADADHAARVEEIEAESAERRTQIQTKLADDLAKNDADLKKSLAKNKKDLAHDLAALDKETGLKAKRLQEDAAREQKRTERQRKIDHLADERLFQFELRQLAAEGQANAIQAALERREIEKQIDKEKTREEDRTKRDETRLELDRLREDADLRRQELEAQAAEEDQRLREQAAERAALLQEQAAEELAKNEERRQEELAKEQAAYEQKLADLAAFREEKLAQAQASKEEAIAKLAEELAESGELTQEELTALIAVAGKLGGDVGKAFAEGLSAGFAKNQQIDNLLGDQSNYQTSGKPGTTGGRDYSIYGPQIPKPKPAPGKTNLVSVAPTYDQERQKSIYGFALGGRMKVYGGGGVDSELVQFMATPGETITVTPPRHRAPSGGGEGGLSIPITVNGVGAEHLAGIIRRKVEEGVEEYHAQVIVPWSQGR